jgi:hypothetical protein
MQFAGAALVPASFLEALEAVGIDGTAMVSTPPETIVEALGPERLGELAPQWVVIGTLVYAGDRALPVSLFELIGDTLEVQAEADALAVDGPPLGARTYWAGWARDVEGVTFLGFAAGFFRAGGRRQRGVDRGVRHDPPRPTGGVVGVGAIGRGR